MGARGTLDMTGQGVNHILGDIDIKPAPVYDFIHQCLIMPSLISYTHLARRIMLKIKAGISGTMGMLGFMNLYPPRFLMFPIRWFVASLRAGRPQLQAFGLLPSPTLFLLRIIAAGASEMCLPGSCPDGKNVVLFL
jgi:hypothetical protein